MNDLPISEQPFRLESLTRVKEWYRATVKGFDEATPEEKERLINKNFTVSNQGIYVHKYLNNADAIRTVVEVDRERWGHAHHNERYSA